MRMHRLLAGPAIAGLMVLAQTLTVGPANAAVTDLACDYDFVHFNACLNFQGSGELNVLIAHVGLDERMAQASAQEIVAGPGSVWATLWADDGGGGRDHFIANLTVDPGWPAAGTDGLGVELSAPVSLFDLNEDPTAGDDDEIYARIDFDDRHGHIVERRTGTVHGDFSPIVIPPDCPTACS